MNASLSGKIALVTGVVRALVWRRLRAGGSGRTRFTPGRRQEELDAAVKSIGSAATGIRADASKLSDLDQVYAQIAKETGSWIFCSLMLAGAICCHSARSRKNSLTGFLV
jgi:NAD(P)-dependent dehydrogenase (short-subunit alcohol dehydrogenase family)